VSNYSRSLDDAFQRRVSHSRRHRPFLRRRSRRASSQQTQPHTQKRKCGSGLRRVRSSRRGSRFRGCHCRGAYTRHSDSRPAWTESNRHPRRRGGSTDSLRSMYSGRRRPGSGVRCAVPRRSAIVIGSAPERCVQSLARAAGARRTAGTDIRSLRQVASRQRHVQGIEK
jgi:hypothetical protein